MNGSIIIICILTILLWYYFTKYSQREIKYLPVMLKQKQVITQLKNENIKMKSKLKYLQTYKDDVSKTFEILDSELVMINDKLKQDTALTENETPVTSTDTQPRLFQTSFTPTILNSLLNSINSTNQTIGTTTTLSNTNTDDLFDNIFNRFLTGQNISSNHIERPLQSSLEEESIQPSLEADTELEPLIESSLEEEPYTQISISSNLIPLNNSYREFLLNRNTRLT